jgi:hypothetical protein
MTQFIHPDEVSAMVKSYAWLIGNMNTDSGPDKDDCLGLLCIGYMISDSVDAMIADYDNQIDALREGAK